MTQNFIVWLTGNSGAGKTTLAYNYRKDCPNCTVLDGDEMRNSISLGAGFSKEEREEHNLRVARLAEVLRKQGHLVLVSVIAPFQSTRKKLEEITPIKWVYLKRTLKEDLNKPYEEPTNASLIIDIDKTDELTAKNILKKAIIEWMFQKPQKSSKIT